MPDERSEDIDVIHRAAGLAPGDALHAARRFRAKVVEATQASHDALLQQPVDGLSSDDRLRVAAHVCTIAVAKSSIVGSAGEEGVSPSGAAASSAS